MRIYINVRVEMWNISRILLAKTDREEGKCGDKKEVFFLIFQDSGSCKVSKSHAKNAAEFEIAFSMQNFCILGGRLIDLRQKMLFSPQKTLKMPEQRWKRFKSSLTSFWNISSPFLSYLRMNSTPSLS